MPVTEYRYSVLKSYEKYQHYRTLIYIYTFLSYGILHLNRKSYTNMKMKLQSDAAFDPTFLSVMDTTFMLFYAIGSFFSGALGDMFPAPLIVSAGLIGASLSMFVFAVLVSMDVERSGNELLRTFTPLLLWLIHGLMQSTGGPANTSIMSHWFGYRHRGYVFGSWTTHQYLGNILSALLASCILSYPEIPWTLVFFIPAVIAFFWGLFCLKNLPDRPESVEGLQNLLKGENSHDEYAPSWAAVMPTITMSEALRIPNVIGYSLAFGLFKFVNYSMFFWLPFYLSQFYKPQTGNLVSIVYDVGNIFGGILVGYISDIYRGRRACVIGTFTCVSIPFLLSISALSEASVAPSYPLFIVLAMLGVFCGGPINIITSAVAIDLAEHSSVGGRSDLMLLTGFINGCGSIIAALGLLLVGPILSTYGWHQVWNVLVGSTLLGTLLLSPAIVREVRQAPFNGISDEHGENDAAGSGDARSNHFASMLHRSSDQSLSLSGSGSEEEEELLNDSSSKPLASMKKHEVYGTLN